MTNTQARVAGMSNRSSHVDVRVYNATTGNYVSLRSVFGLNFIRTVTWQEDIDDNGRTATIVLDRNIYNYSLSPLVQHNRIWNTYNTLININVPVKIYAAIKPFGQVPTGVSDPDWIEVFWGRIYQMDFAAYTFNLSCRDWLDQLQSLWIENSAGIIPAYPSGNAAYNIMQLILNYGAGLTGANLQLSTLFSANGTATTPFVSGSLPDDPGWAIKSDDPYPTSLMTLWTALDNINQQIGWTLRQAWNKNINTWALTWKDPLRTNTTSMYTFVPASWLAVSTCQIHLGDIRNQVQIWYQYGGPTGSGLASVYPPAVSGRTDYSKDASSISQYGRQFMQIGTDATTLITGAMQTGSSLYDFEAMAQNAISDLSQPNIDFSVDVPLFPFVELNDLYTFSADDKHFSNNQTLAAISYSSTIDTTTIGKTTLGMRGKPSAGVSRWFSRQIQNFTKRLGSTNTNNSSDQGANLTSNASFSQFTRH